MSRLPTENLFSTTNISDNRASNLFGAPTTQETPLFEFAFGFLPTFNVGSALGVKDDFGRIAADILLDPISLGLAFFSGGLSLGGKASLATSRLASLGGKVGKLSGLSKVKKIEGLNDIFKVAAKGASNPELLNQLNTAAKLGNSNAFIKTAKLIRNSKISDDVLKQLPTSKELDVFAEALDLQEKFLKAGGTFEDITKIADSRAGQVIAGQRDLLRFKVPFTNIEKRILGGEKAYRKFDKLFQYKGGTFVKGSTDTLKEMTINTVKDRSLDFQEQINKSILLKKNANKAFADLAFKGGVQNANEVNALKKLAFFYREGKVTGKGIPNDLELLAKIGLDILPDSLKGLDLTTFKSLDEAINKAGLDEAFKYADNLLEGHYDDWLKQINQAKGLAGKDKVKEMLKKKASVSPAMSFLGDTAKKSKGGEMKSTKGYGAARQSGMGLQDENLIPGKSMDYYKDLM